MEGGRKEGKETYTGYLSPKNIATHTNFSVFMCLIVVHQSYHIKDEKTEACGNELIFLTPEPMFF